MNESPPRVETGFEAERAKPTLRAFLQQLQTSEGLVEHLSAQARDALRLASTLLEPRGEAPAQVAIMGPTQTGKSTLVNALLGRKLAEISPLAGFTIHPQGFWLSGPLPKPARSTPAVQQRTLFEMEEDTDDSAQTPAWAQWALPGWQLRKPDALTREELDAFVLEPLPQSQATKSLGECVVWDTPDFDSLAAEGYRTGLLGVSAIADVFVLVVSKEKYADRSVWDWLDLLAPLQKPLIVCLNKLTPDAVGPISSAIVERLNTLELWRTAPLVTLPVLDDVAEYSRDEFAELRAHVATALKTERASEVPAAARLSHAHWSSWTQPILQEHAALDDWKHLVGDSFERLLQAYENDYLNRPDRFDSFRRATIELLELLELPVIGGALAQARSWVTWPARQIWASGRSLLGRHESKHQKLSGELAFLHDELELLLVALQREVSHRAAPGDAGSAVWNGIAERLEHDQEELLALFKAGALAHHEQVTQEIHTAANELYETLKNSPKLLNTLRSARVTTDVLAIFMAVKSAGLNMYDLIAAPAMFGLTSLLTEGALGSYMHRIAAQLKQRQLADARDRLVEANLRPPLEAMTERVIQEDLIGILPAELQAARAAITTLGGTDE